MRNVWRVFTRDLKRLGRVPLAWVIIGGALITPSLYAWFNISAFWDPFDNTKNLSIAVVNLDKGGETSLTGELNVGDQLVAQLKDNTDLGWHFVSETEAMESIKSGESYAAFVVPETFTQDLLSITTGTFTQPKLQYYVNEKLNGVAPEITDTGSTTIATQMTDAFTSQVATAVATTLKASGDSAEGRLLSAQDRAIGELSQASDTIGKTRVHLGELQIGIGSTRDKLTAAADSLPRIDATLVDVQAILGDARTLADQAQTKLLDLTAAATTAYVGTASKVADAAAATDAAVGKLTRGIEQAQSRFDTAITDAQTALEANSEAIAQVQAVLDEGELDPAVRERLTTALGELNALNAGGEQLLADLTAASDALGAGAEAVRNVATAADTALQDAAQSAQSLSTAVAGSVPALQKALLTLTASTQALSSSLDAQRSILAEAGVLLEGLNGQLETTSAALTSLDGNFADLQGDMNVAVTDLRTLASAAAWQQIESVASLNPAQIAEFMSTPVVVKQITIFPTNTYGSLMASLFINLSLWIGAFVLVVILKLEVDREGIPDLTERQGYMGRWLLFAMISTMQAIVLSIGNLMIGVQHVNVFAFIVTPILIGLTYHSIIYALSVTFGYIGKGLCIILVIMQIPGASGIYPIELMPPFFQSLYPFFPFTYGIDAMREVISGFAGDAYWRYLGTLALFAALAFFLGLVLRRGVSNLTRLFTQDVGATELFTTEEGAPSGRGYRLNHVLRALANRASYQQRLAKRALPFARSYRKVRGAIVTIGILGIVLLVALAMLFPDNKTEFVGLWVAWLIIVFAALVTLEYIRYSLRLSSEVANMPEAELRRELAELEARK